MTVWEWLTSPIGIELTHAVILVLLALAGFLNYLAHRKANEVQSELSGHLADHSASSNTTTSGVTSAEGHNP